VSDSVQSLPLTESASADDKKTKAGNYFVSNYPPFSFWTPQQTGEAYAALERAPRPGAPMGAYVHIPFCRKRCHFCYFKVYTDKNAAAIRHYLDCVLRELTVYASKPFVGGRLPRFIYFGGGTPSYISADQLKYLTDGMKALLPWDEAQEVTFEAEPGTLNEKKLRRIRKMGVTRLSLGVENFDDGVLEVNGRAHLSAEIEKAYAYARSIEFPQINIDLIAGMLNETDENWQRNIQKTIDLSPDCVTIYQMEIPFNTTIFKWMRDQGKEIAPVADWATKRRWVAEAFAALERNGYTVTSAYTVVKDPKTTKFVYRDALWTGADLIGLGVSSFGHVSGTHYQNEHNIEPYTQRVDVGELPLWRARTMTEEEALIREFILQMKTGAVDLAYFREKFGVDVGAHFAEPIRHLQVAGYASLEGGAFRLSREGLLQVDRLLLEFFLPEHQNARYA
jgi:coproporphyrinogen III oxidase-like Fe-S oxidoreductase